jgi:hypothetical protein
VRTVYAVVNAIGEVFAVWYVGEDPPTDVAERNGGTVLGPFKARVPEPPVDMWPMFDSALGYWAPDNDGHRTRFVDVL